MLLVLLATWDAGNDGDVDLGVPGVPQRVEATRPGGHHTYIEQGFILWQPRISSPPPFDISPLFFRHIYILENSPQKGGGGCLEYISLILDRKQYITYFIMQNNNSRRNLITRTKHFFVLKCFLLYRGKSRKGFGWYRTSCLNVWKKLLPFLVLNTVKH